MCQPIKICFFITQRLTSNTLYFPYFKWNTVTEVLLYIGLKELKHLTKTLPFNVKSLLLEHFG